MRYCSTRDNRIQKTSGEVIVDGISKEGGLFLPETVPAIGADGVQALAGKSYADSVPAIVGRLLDDFPPDLLGRLAGESYSDSAFPNGPAPLCEIEDGLFSLELWHGPTLAFKDIALQLMPRLFAEAKRINRISSESLILVATSGDTGKAALEGYRDVPGVRIMVFYPRYGVSEIQRLQMITQGGENLFVAGVDGNFDDAQRAVKSLMTDTEIKALIARQGMAFSSANSINWGRLVPQIVYYFTAYAALRASGRIVPGAPVNFAVPSGNFGNILAGYFAKLMGLPIRTLISASNRNNVLSDFIGSGCYLADRSFYTTISPSMDILVSSNVERLVFLLSGRDGEKTKRYYETLRETGRFCLDDGERRRMQDVFAGYCSDDDETRAKIGDLYRRCGYLADPHTAVAFDAAEKHRKIAGDWTPTVVLSTASPYKFAGSILPALGHPKVEGFGALDALEKITGLPVPLRLSALRTAPVRFDNCFAGDGQKQALLSFVGSLS